MTSSSHTYQNDLPPLENRLGVRGKWAIPNRLAKSAQDHGLVITATRLKNEYSISPMHNYSVAPVLPGFGLSDGAIDRKTLKQALKYLHQPLRNIAHEIADADYEVDIEDVLDAEQELRMRPEFIGHEAPRDEIDLSVERRLAATRRASVKHSAEILHDNLYRAIGFIARGSVQEEKLHNNGHGDYDDHDDGCEVVAEDMEQAEAKKNASETSGVLLEGFRFSRKFGKYRLNIHQNFAQGNFEGEGQKQLHSVLKKALHDADPHFQWQDNLTKIYLNAVSLKRFCQSVYDQTQGADAPYELVIEDVLHEEITTADLEHVAAKTLKLEVSPLLGKLNALNPHAQLAQVRITQLSSALSALETFIDTPEMQSIWKKYNITGRYFKSTDNPLEQLCIDIERLQRVIDHHMQHGLVESTHLEAIAIEFRDVIAGGREIIGVLSSALEKPFTMVKGLGETKLQLRHLDHLLANASLAPTSMPRSTMSEAAQEIAHYVGRHTQQESVDPVGAFNDFVEDFGGEVAGFVMRNKTLTLALGLTFWYSMNAAAAQGGDGGAMVNAVSNAMSGVIGAGGEGFDQTATLADLLGTQGTVTPMSIDDIERKFGSQAIEVCHFHLPVKVPYFEHCLVSDQAVKQLQDGVALFKGPLSTILDAPADGISLLAPQEEGAPPIYALDNFKSTLRTTGDFWFFANGYQNLAHAPWAAVSASMGYKLGSLPAMRRTSGLITPLIDGAYGLTVDNKYLLANLPMAAYGYSEQGLSGAVMGVTMSSIGAYGVRGAQNIMQKGIEFLPHGYAVQEVLPKNARFGVKEASLVIRLSGAKDNVIESLIPKPEEKDFKRTETGLFVPVSFDQNAKPPIAKHNNSDKPKVELFGENQDTDFSYSIGGKSRALNLNAETYLDLMRDLTSFAFLLEHATEKLGVTEDKLEADEQLVTIKKILGRDKLAVSKITDLEYAEYLKRITSICIEALEQYASGVISSGHLQAQLQTHIETIHAAKLIHLDAVDNYHDAQQNRALSITGNKMKRLFQREAARRNDDDDIARVFFNAGRNLHYWRHMPASMGTSLTLKSISATALYGKHSLRNAWSFIRDEVLPVAQLGYNKLTPEAKGTIIGSALTTGALALQIDANTEFANTISDALPFGGQDVINAMKDYSGAIGHVGGATTATGLFSVYNFGEDHLIIHITMGYACIILGGGARVVAYPLAQAGKVAEVLAEELADISQGYMDVRKPSRAIQKEMRNIRRLVRDVKSYDFENTMN